MSVTQSARMSKITNDGLTRCDTGGRACVTADVDEVVGRHQCDAWLDAVLAWNVWLDLETDSSLAGVLKSKPCRYHVCKRTYNRIEDFFRLKSGPKTIVTSTVRLSVCICPRALRRVGRAAAAEIFNRRAERRRRRNFWPPPAQINGVAENATVAERQSMIFLSTMWWIRCHFSYSLAPSTVDKVIFVHENALLNE